MSDRAHAEARRAPQRSFMRLRAGAPAVLLGRPAPRVARALDPRAEHILALQRTAGNAAVVQLISEATEGVEQEAVDIYEDVAVVETARAIFRRGAELYAAGDFAHAYDELTRAHELIPDPALVFSRAQALRRLGGRREEAIALYEEYLSSDPAPRAGEARQHLAELRTSGSGTTADIYEPDVDAARQIFRGAATRYAAGDFAHAYDELTRAWELIPDPALLFDRAQALRRLGGRREEAIALYEAYLSSGQAPRAEEATQALADLRTPESTGMEELDIEIASAIFRRGAELYAAGDFAHAYDELTRAHELIPDPALVFSRAQALRRLGGRREEAIALYEEYLASDPAPRAGDAGQALDELRTPRP